MKLFTKYILIPAEGCRVIIVVLSFLDNLIKATCVRYVPWFFPRKPLFGQHQSMVDKFSKSHKDLPTIEGCGQLFVLDDVR